MCYVFPTSLIEENSIFNKTGHRVSNLNNINVVNSGLLNTFSLENITNEPHLIVGYIYAILYSTQYQYRYNERLKRDFPRIPIICNKHLFHELSCLGGELIKLHLMDSPKLTSRKTMYKGPINPIIKKIIWHNDTVYLEATGTKKNELTILGNVGFEGVPEEVWNFQIGGYQVCQRWLKDRKNRMLSTEDIEHFQKISTAIKETICLKEEIDKTIEKHGGWPRAFRT